MGAPKGNQFWKQRTKHGVDKLFSSPEVLYEEACKYFQWCDDNPWQKHEPVKAGPEFGNTVQAPIARPYTISGLCLFLKIDQATLYSYETSESHKDFHKVVTCIKEIIYTQKFEGAAVGAFNANIIARDLGLKDSQEITGANGGPIQFSDTERAARLATLIGKVSKRAKKEK
jgi:hypothetical protein